ELSCDAYFDIEPNDIFPSQFKVFFSANEAAFNHFYHYHSDIFSASFWQSCQQQVRQGHLPDVYPYEQSWRFK
ncbi:isocitrate dehydrogenase kinase/phosphatase-domain containing protein, partial [Pseudoalteromonas sp.]|uniref:isocitrate dehydrogenase kinase/phosphatase-domain containing protein n=1 Tax=Pseudoalteromonas sp. TaxID=53249 RepID=UPI003569D91A